MNCDFDIAIIGGGPAGSTAASFLTKSGSSVCLFEKENFPRETLCGEFLSKEVIRIIDELAIKDKFLNQSPNKIHNLKIFNSTKKLVDSELGFEGFGLKRSVFDEILLQNARENGARIFQPAEVVSVQRNVNDFLINYNDGDLRQISSKKVIAAYGKQNKLDKKIKRSFINKRSRLNGFKFHIDLDFLNNFKEDEIQLFLGDKIYCGVNKVSDTEAAVCFLGNWKNKSLSAIEYLKKLSEENIFFNEVTKNNFWEKASKQNFYGKANIHFYYKELVKNGIFMIGDSARVIPPFVGDGIGMAMESGKLIGEIFSQQKIQGYSNQEIEKKYSKEWNKLFVKRLRAASVIHKLLMNSCINQTVFNLIKIYPNLVNKLIRKTRGQ